MNLLSDSVECPVCLKLYCNPLILTNCGHTFCAQCVHGVTRDEHVKCPMCNTETPLVSAKCNYALQAVIETLGSQKPSIQVAFHEAKVVRYDEVIAREAQTIPSLWCCLTMNSRKG